MVLSLIIIKNVNLYIVGVKKSKGKLKPPLISRKSQLIYKQKSNHNGRAE